MSPTIGIDEDVFEELKKHAADAEYRLLGARWDQKAC